MCVKAVMESQNAHTADQVNASPLWLRALLLEVHLFLQTHRQSAENVHAAHKVNIKLHGQLILLS